MVASVNIVTQEQVIVTLDVSIVIWNSPKIKEAHQILILTVDIAEDLDWCINTQHHRLILKHVLALLCQSDDVFSSESEVAISIELRSPFSRSQQMRQEQIVQSIFLHVLLGHALGARFFLRVLELLHWHVNRLAAWLLLNFCLVDHNFVVHARQTLHWWRAASICVVSLPLHLARGAAACSVCLALHIVFRTDRLLQFSNQSRNFREKLHQV